VRVELESSSIVAFKLLDAKPHELEEVVPGTKSIAFWHANEHPTSITVNYAMTGTSWKEQLVVDLDDEAKAAPGVSLSLYAVVKNNCGVDLKCDSLQLYGGKQPPFIAGGGGFARRQYVQLESAAPMAAAAPGSEPTARDVTDDPLATSLVHLQEDVMLPDRCQQNMLMKTSVQMLFAKIVHYVDVGHWNSEASCRRELRFQMPWAFSSAGDVLVYSGDGGYRKLVTRTGTRSYLQKNEWADIELGMATDVVCTTQTSITDKRGRLTTLQLRLSSNSKDASRAVQLRVGDGSKKQLARVFMYGKELAAGEHERQFTPYGVVIQPSGSVDVTFTFVHEEEDDV
jgi:hypothetical protein